MNEKATKGFVEVVVCGGGEAAEMVVAEMNVPHGGEGFIRDSCAFGLRNWQGVRTRDDTTKYTYLVNRSPSSAIGLKKPVDMLGSFGWLASIKQGILEPVKVVLYRNMGFNESGEYKKLSLVLVYATKGLLDKAKENVLGMEIIKDQSGYTLRVSQSRPDIASTDVGMLDGFDRGLQTYVQVFVDFDYAMGRSITRYGFMILGCAGSLKANLQRIEALSTTEAGNMALTEAVKEAIWLRGLLEELGVELNRMTVNFDNQGAIHLSQNHVFNERTKHINVRYHFIREVLEAKTVEILKVGTEHNAADDLTKVVPGHKLQHCLKLLSVGIG
nr:retrovirus-related Pol polyprotein from transposon TNT 1-94 [Tanacetum cinerariifolium]